MVEWCRWCVRLNLFLFSGASVVACVRVCVRCSVASVVEMRACLVFEFELIVNMFFGGIVDLLFSSGVDGFDVWIGL